MRKFSTDVCSFFFAVVNFTMRKMTTGTARRAVSPQAAPASSDKPILHSNNPHFHLFTWLSSVSPSPVFNGRVPLRQIVLLTHFSACLPHNPPVTFHLLVYARVMQVLASCIRLSSACTYPTATTKTTSHQFAN